MADQDTSERPLEVLSTMFNQALLQTGKFFRDATSHDPRDLAFARRSISRAIQPADEKFQHALDEIEIEIIRAKSVLERDLALIRLKRAERNKAQGAIKLRGLNHEKEGVVGNEAGKQHQGESTSIVAVSEQNKHDDVIMIDDEDTITMIPAPGKPKPAIAPNGVDSEYAGSASSEIQHGVLGSSGLALKVDPSLASKIVNTLKVTPVGQNDLVNQSERPTETPTTANLRESDFETMFDDTEAVRTQEIDFGLEFTASAHVLNDNGFENGPLQNEDVTSLNTTSNEDINTLLPGLENYVNATDDFAVIGLNTGTTVPNNNGANAENTSAPQPLEPVLAESNFDDLFPTSNFIDDGEDYEMDGSGDINDLDDFDHWFNSNAI